MVDFGNPYPISHMTEPADKKAAREKAIKRFRGYFLHRVKWDKVFRAAVLALEGKTLGCFCKPQACHGDVILEWLESQKEATSDDTN